MKCELRSLKEVRGANRGVLELVEDQRVDTYQLAGVTWACNGISQLAEGQGSDTYQPMATPWAGKAGCDQGLKARHIHIHRVP